MAAAIMTACGTTTIVDTRRYVKVEDIIPSTSKEYKYKAVAWQYKPRIKKYIIYTDSLYSIGSWVEIKK
jgi:hypothetical protein